MKAVAAASGITAEEANSLIDGPDDDLPGLLARASRVRAENKGLRVHLCGIVNAKSGLCAQDCAFCAQSAHNRAPPPVYPLLDEEDIVARGRAARADGARSFGIVTSGYTLERPDEVERVARAVRRLRIEVGITPCASLGNLSRDALSTLKEAGLVRYHHNLEAARSFYPEVCTTRTYGDNVATVRRAVAAGLEACSGVLFGLGESTRQRVELGLALRELGVGSVPVNFLHPIPGTRLGHRGTLEPFAALRAIAVLRLLLPRADIRLCGGRERVLGDLHSWIFLAGANGVMIGDYLTTRGRSPADDRRMIADQGLSAAEG